MEDAAKIQEEFLRNFQAIFSPSDRRVAGPWFCVAGAPYPYAYLWTEAVLRPFTEGEVAEAVSQIGAGKALGPEGIPALFYQSCWSITVWAVFKGWI